LLHGDAKYMDILEKTLYNGLISGVGMDGKSFFYTNAMEIKNSIHHADMEGERSGWFTCSCCPTNVTRLIPSVSGYMYAQRNNDVYVNLFISGNTNLTIQKKQVSIQQQHNYPWDGKLVFTVTPQSPQAFNVLIRIPGWAQNQAMPSTLYTFTDVIEVNLPMDVRKIEAIKNVKDDVGRIALQRGPLVYCAEWADNNGKTSNLILPANTTFTTEFKPDLLQGVTVLQGEATAIQVDAATNTVSSAKQAFTAIPYYAWAHRGKGEMSVWFPTNVSDIAIIPK
jgi:uncharacterized protein